MRGDSCIDDFEANRAFERNAHGLTLATFAAMATLLRDGERDESKTPAPKNGATVGLVSTLWQAADNKQAAATTLVLHQAELLPDVRSA